MAEMATRETFVEAVTRLLDGRKLTWLAERTEGQISYGRLQRLMNISGTYRSPEPTLHEATVVAGVFGVTVGELTGESSSGGGVQAAATSGR